jgi:hypothetical protein
MPAGRPRVFNSPEELQSAIEDSFALSESKSKKITITGLAYDLGFESRQSFYDYEKNGEYSYVIKRARLFVESKYEESLSDGKPVGAIFALKNMGWADKQEIDQTTKHSGEIHHKLDYSKLSDAALRELASLDKPQESQD